jgi:hypothetical protein
VKQVNSFNAHTNGRCVYSKDSRNDNISNANCHINNNSSNFNIFNKNYNNNVPGYKNQNLSKYEK